MDDTVGDLVHLSKGGRLVVIHPKCRGCIHLREEICSKGVCAVVRSSLRSQGFHVFGPVEVAVGEYMSLIVEEGERVG